MSNSRSRISQVRRVSTLMAALLGVFSVHAQSAPDVTANNGDDFSLDATQGYDKLTANAGGQISGSGITLTGAQNDSNNGSVAAFGGGKITLSGSTIANAWNGCCGARAVHARGAGSTITLQDTSVTMTANQASNADSTSVIAATEGGQVDITGGTLTANGAYVRGIVADGSTVDGTPENGGEYIKASGVDIVTNGANGIGVQAYGADTGDATKITTVELDGGSVQTTAATYAPALQSARQGALIIVNGTDLSSVGSNGMTVDVNRGGSVQMTDGSILASGAQSSAVSVDGAGSTMSLDNTAVTAGGAKARAVSATNGGQITLTGGSVAATDSGTNTMGLYADGAGSSISASGTSVSVAGTGTNGGNAPVGVNASNGASVSLTDGSVQMGGSDRSIGVRATTGGTITIDGTAISTVGDNSHAVFAFQSVGSPSPEALINISGGSVTTSGSNSYALYAENGGSQVNASNVQVATTGDIGRGVYAWVGGVVNVTGGSVLTQGANAEGMMAAGTGAQIVSSGVNIETRGTQSAGIAAGWSDASNGMINFSNGSITTSGQGSAGAAAQLGGAITLGNASVTANGTGAAAVSVGSGGTMTIAGSTLTSTQSAGISLTDNASIALTGTTVNAAGASIVSTLDTGGQTQNITIGANSTLTQNNGTLLQVNRSADGMDGIVNLTLKAGSVSGGDIVDLDGLTKGGADTRDAGGKTNFVIENGAFWSGVVQGLNDATIGDGGSFVNDGSAPIAGNVDSGNNATVVFNNQAQVAGSVQSGAGSTVNFNGPAVIGQNASGDGAAFTFAGPATIQQNAIAENGASFQFNGAATISQNVQATGGSTFAFSGPTTISNNVSASGSSFTFSKTSPTVIGGNVSLDSGSSTHGGTIDMPVAIGGDVAVNSGSTLGGNLVVQGALSGSNSTLAPGNSVGTQSYGSIAGFTGNYVAEVNSAGKSDQIIVRGNADISGIGLRVAQENGNGGYRLNTPYTVLSTTDGGIVQNQFASTGLDATLSNTLVMLDPVSYNTDNVQVSLSLDPGKIAAKQGGLNGNQRSTLDGLISVAGQNASADAAFTSADTAGSLNQLSGDFHASVRSALLEDRSAMSDAIGARMRSNLGLQGMTAAQAGGAQGPGAYPVWGQFINGHQSLDASHGAGGVTNSTNGFIVGGDAVVGGWRLGGAAGVSNGTIDGRGDATADVDSYNLALYGGNSWQAGMGKLNLLLGTGYTWNKIDTQRSVTVGGNQTLKSSYDANAAQVFADMGYAMPLGAASTIEPYLGLAWFDQRTGSFKESGGDAALRGDSDTSGVATFTLGLRGTTAFQVNAALTTLHAGLGWRRASGDTDPTTRLAFVQGSGTTFGETGAPISRNAAVADLGAEVALGKNAAMGVSYNGQFGNNGQDNAGSLYLRLRY